MRLLKTIRLDASDDFVFERAAPSEDVAVTGSFLFWNADVEALTGKTRSAFRAGFLGIRSFGFSTLATVAEVTEADRDAAIALLAERLVTHCGAPDVQTALPAAREEIAFAESLADHPVGTLIALHRALEDGEIREQFRTLRPGQPAREGRAFSFVETDAPDEIEESVDLKAMLGGGR
jgi:hypothetical protein